MRSLKITNMPLCGALIDACVKQPYQLTHVTKDIVAGITVGIIAIPLAMALAIASGVAPQNGLYTAIIAGIVIAFLGGSRFSVSGPTAAFVVILYPVSQHFGLSGLLIATLISGCFLILLGVCRLGRLIEYIPVSVTLGFTSGIAITIATMQLKDFFGLSIEHVPEHYIDKVGALLSALPTLHVADALIGIVTLALLIYWPRFRLPLPGHLPALLLGMLLMAIFSLLNIEVATIGSRFSYVLTDGTEGQGIPSMLPQFTVPWEMTFGDGKPFQFDWSTSSILIKAAFSMAILGAIESLLCAVVLDGMTGKKHHSNNELIAQGIGNIITPFFGGITATAAIARSAANVRAGAISPVAAIIHGVVVLVALLLLAQWLSYIPLAAMAALLLMVAWGMSEARKVIALIRFAPKDDVLLLFTCMILTVLFDMVIAITVGIVFAALLFMRRIARMTRLVEVQYSSSIHDDTLVLRVMGPLFFAAADRIFNDLASQSEPYQHIVLQWDAVPVLDAGGLSALTYFIEHLPIGKTLSICELPYQPLKTLARARIQPIEDKLFFYQTLREALSDHSDLNT